MSNFNSRSPNAIKRWDIINNARVKLEYNDGDVLYVRIDDFHQAFGCITSASKEAVEKDFAIDPTTILYKEPKLTGWETDGERIKLIYADNDTFYIAKDIFHKAYHCIFETPKSIVKNDFALMSDVSA